MSLLLCVIFRWKGKLQRHGWSRHHHASDYSQRCAYLHSGDITRVPQQNAGPYIRYMYTLTRFVCVAFSSWLDPSSVKEARGSNRSGANREPRSKSTTRFKAQKIASSPSLARRTRFRMHSTCYRTGNLKCLYSYNI